jgi:hypothetical protein
LDKFSEKMYLCAIKWFCFDKSSRTVDPGQTGPNS